MQKYRSVFISDIHLGTKASQTEALLSFMKTFECDRLYLVGDIIDCWAMSKSIYWDQSHNDVIQKILRKGRKGTEIIYVSGNHDEILRKFGEHIFGNIHLMESTIHLTVDNKPLIVMHGDQFDVVIKNAKWLAHVGSWAYDLTMVLNTLVARVRGWFGLPYWSLSQWAKYKVKEAVNFIGDYEENLTQYAKTHNAAGIVCGHIHHANIRDIDGIKYINCGDWVESCTAIVEHYDGRLELIRWKDESKETDRQALRSNSKQRQKQRKEDLV
jgi:UDP-2,3-diacylglucosamine pyrophosphatase LpxH